MKILLGKKLGMTQMFDDDGRALGVTVVEVWPATVTRLRETEKDGYEAIQVGAGTAKKVGKAVGGQAKGKSFKVLKEFPKPSDDVKAGDTLGIDQFEVGDV